MLEETFAVAHVRADAHDLVARAEAAAEQAVLMELLQPLRVVDVCLAARNVLRVSRVNEQNFESAALKNLVDRDPVDAGGLHRDRSDAQAVEPIC